MPKRGENIYKRRDGRWEGRFICERKPNGQALYHSVYGKSYAEVRQKLQVQREENSRRLLRGCTMTVKTLIDCWLSANSYSIKSSSQERYRLLIDKHINPELGSILVCNLTAEILNQFVEKKLRNGRLDGKGGLAPKTVNDILVIIKSALKLASRKYQYKGSDLSDVKAPAMKGRKIEVFGENETKIMAEAAVSVPTITNLSILMSLEAGLRLGEVCALRWSDINFDDGVVHIRRTALRINYGGRSQLTIQTPKSDASERIVPLTAKLLNLLKAARNGVDPEAYILTGSSRKPMEPRTMQYRFQRFLKILGIKKRGYHATRHSFATRCAEHGVDAKSLSEILGHANVQTTLQMYVHPSMEAKRQYMELASAMTSCA